MSMRQKPGFVRIRRVLALIAGTILALSILLGVAFVLVELHHDCTGEDCVICAAVQQDVAYLKAEAAALQRMSCNCSFFSNGSADACSMSRARAIFPTRFSDSDMDQPSNSRTQ